MAQNTGRSTISIDFGPDNQTSAAPWNNVTNAQTGSVANLLNNEGNSTGISIAVTDRFNSWNLDGVTAHDSLGIPHSASRESFYGNTVLFNNATVPFSTLTVSNLDPAKAYSFAFFAARADVNDNRETLYTVTGLTTGTTTLNATNNTSRMARVSNVQPRADGTITIRVEPGPNNNNGSKFFYLAAMKISYASTVSGVSPEIASGKIKVYPNPATGKVIISSAGDYKIKKIQLLSLAGTKVLVKEKESAAVSSIDVSGLAPGAYYMHIHTNQGTFHTKLLVQ